LSISDPLPLNQVPSQGAQCSRIKARIPASQVSAPITPASTALRKATRWITTAAVYGVTVIVPVKLG
jgi:hypothetical protein